jgi:hypothetical protein
MLMSRRSRRAPATRASIANIRYAAIRAGGRHASFRRVLARAISGLITDEGVAVGGAFDSDTATGMMPVSHRVAGVLAFRRS